MRGATLGDLALTTITTPFGLQAIGHYQTMNKPVTGRLVSYKWAIDESGRPSPIETAQHGRQYRCPLCGRPMIARLGDQVVHHFSHDRANDCSAETVNLAVLRHWLKAALSITLAEKKAIMVSWTCAKCQMMHTANLLDKAAHYIENYQLKRYPIDLALVDGAGNMQGVILIRETLDDAERNFFTHRDLFTLIIPPNAVPMRDEFLSLVEQSQVISGPCPNLLRIAGLVRHTDSIKQVLRESVARWPGQVAAALETLEYIPNIVRIGGKMLWLPYERWQEIVGGTHHKIGDNLTVTIENWVHSDGGTIWLYYVNLRNTAAIGIRRYSPGVMGAPEIDGSFALRRTTALDVARTLVSK